MKNNPYIGPRPYEREDEKYFHGRNREARDLISLIQAERLVLFYAQSGAGKTSLLNAKVLPELETQGFHIFPTVRVGSELPPGVPDSAISNCFVFSALIGLAGAEVDPEALRQHTLASFIQSIYPAAADAQTEAPPLLIFDQFEEMFTTHRHRWEDARGLFMQLRDALDQLPALGVVLAMREDFVAELDPYAPMLPRRLNARFRMERLGEKGALEAITRPAQELGIRFAPAEGDIPDAAAWLCDQLRTLKVQQKDANGNNVTATVLGPFVEPVQLQVVCRRLWDNLPEQEDAVIQKSEIEQYGDIDRALIDFYEVALNAVVAETQVNERELRRWFSRQMITPLGTRGLVLRGPDETGGIPNKAVDAFNRHHIIRADVRAGARWYELAHDRLIEPISRSNRRWEATRETPLRLAARSWNETHNPGLLYRGDALAAAEKEIAAHPTETESYEREFVTASRSLERKRLITYRLIVGAGALSALLLLLITFLALRAEKARKLAEEQRRIAQARQLAAQALIEKDARLDLALLLSLEGNRLADLPDVQRSLAATVTANPQLLTFLNGHISRVEGVAFSPDQQELVSVGGNGEVLFWDMRTRKAIPQHLLGEALHDADVGNLHTVVYSPNGKWLATGGDNGTVYLWDATTHRIEKRLLAHTSIIRSLAFSPDGRWLVSGGADNRVVLWDLQPAPHLVATFEHSHDEVRGLAFSPDSRLVIGGSCQRMTGFSCKQGELLAWDVISQTLVQHIAAHTDRISSLAFHPNGLWFASAGWDREVRLWDARTFEPIGKPFTEHNDHITWLRFSPGGRWLASSGWDGLIVMREFPNATSPDVGSTLILKNGHAGQVNTLDFSPDGEWLATGGGDRHVIVWDFKTRNFISNVLTETHSPVNDIVFSNDGHWMAHTQCEQYIEESCQHGQIVLWDMETRRPVSAPWTAHAESIYKLAFSPDGQQLASVGSDQSLKVWDTATQQEIGPVLEGHGGEVNAVTYSPDGKILASAGNDHTVRLWDAHTHARLGEPLLNPAGIYALDFTPDGNILAAASCAVAKDEVYCREGAVYLWDIQTRQMLTPLKALHTNWVLSLDFSPDGKTLATGSADGRIALWDWRTGEARSPVLVGHTNWVNRVAFGPDGAWLASASDDKTLIFWDLQRMTPLAPPLEGHEAWVYTLAFYPGALIIASGSEDGRIILWDADFASWKEKACQRANRNLTQEEWVEYIDPDVTHYRRTCPNLE